MAGKESRKSSKRSQRVTSERVHQMMLGTLLGDGAMAFTIQNPTYSSNHSWKQHKYNCLKYQVLSRYTGTPPKKMKNGGYGKWSSYFRTLSQPAFIYYRDLCYRKTNKLYSNGRNRYAKRVTRSWLEQINWEGIAWWIADDGSLQGTKTSPSMTMHTEGFSKKEVYLLASWLRVKKKVPCTVAESKSRKTPGKLLYTIRINLEGTLRLLQKTRKYAPHPMRYKWAIGPRVTTAVCEYCEQEFKLSRSQTKDPQKIAEKRLHCRRKACIAARRKEVQDKYGETHREEINRKSSERYYADHERLREYHRQRTAAWLEKNRDKYNARRRARRAAAAKARPPRELICNGCGKTFPCTTSANVKYCGPECKQIARKESQRKYDARTRSSSGCRK